MNEYIEKKSAESYSDLMFQQTLCVANIFDRSDALDDRNLFISRFNRLPNWIQLEDVDAKKANEWLVENYRDDIVDCSYVKRHEKQKGIFTDDTYYFLFDDLLVYLNVNQSEAKLLYRKTDSVKVEEIANEIVKFKAKGTRKKPEIEILYNSRQGLALRSMEITRPKFSIDENYNDDFLPVHETILTRLRKKNGKGIVLLHGKPGTGKTSYIRYLITKTQKRVIFLPPNMAACITDPSLMNILLGNPNSVFVIEDAENIIIDRNNRSGSPVSTLLNIADGLLSDCINIQIICSFNTDLSRVDSALTRKGRLIAKYEFDHLQIDKAQTLSNKLGFNNIISSPMSLAAIYNQHETEFMLTAKRTSIGFKIAV